jgi:hypothetical protein
MFTFRAPVEELRKTVEKLEKDCAGMEEELMVGPPADSLQEELDQLEKRLDGQRQDKRRALQAITQQKEQVSSV